MPEPRYCSACEKPHDIGVPCAFCGILWKCENCGAKVPVAVPLSCAKCGYSRPMSAKERAALIHPPTMWYCPALRDGKVCNRKLRGGPRDKKRAWKVKN